MRRLRREDRGTRILIFDLYLSPLLILLRLLTIRQPRLYLDLHDSRLRNPKRIPFFLLAMLANNVVCVSEYISRQIPLGKAAVVWRGIEPRAQTPLPKRFCVGVVGQVTTTKRIREAIEEVAMVPGDVRLEIRGSAPDPEYLTMVASLGDRLLGERIVFTGLVRSSEVFDDLTLLLVMNDDEPSGRVVAEAQSAGVIVICPHGGGASEFVVHGVTGFKFDSRIPGDCARVIKQLIEADRLSEVRRDARRFADEHYSLELQGREYLRALAIESVVSEYLR
ncbi:glycosyltransferase family 4 protein [Microbacterium sp. 11MF]|uniref:glycosyltransferase family 4 protein n=1 Tax=Microbacterium sp. 11MF TaxID=1169146 RepID=UPI0018CB6B1A|nr:glycosyltransferase family 4 protein [Microbacterium sp. 11MF]